MNEWKSQSQGKGFVECAHVADYEKAINSKKTLS
jgi:hypothetical protein